MARNKIEKDPLFQCPFCDKKFKLEKTVLSHKCVKRDRYNERNSRLMNEAYRIWLFFMDYYKLKMKSSVEPLMQFVKSKQFNDFYDFAEYTMNNHILNKEDFIKEIITSGKTVFEWRSHKTYNEWVLKCTRNEHPRRGIERSINAIQEWSTTTGEEWTTFFSTVSVERAIMWFESGKLSPWIIYASAPENGSILFNRFSDSEIEYITQFINPLIWQPLQIRFKNEVNELKIILQEFGL